MVVLIVFGSTIVDERKVRKKKKRKRERECVRVTCHLSLSGEVTGPERDCALS